jgi:CBS domain-containing protein
LRENPPVYARPARTGKSGEESQARLSDGVATHSVRGPMGRMYSNASRSPGAPSEGTKEGMDVTPSHVASTYITWSSGPPNVEVKMVRAARPAAIHVVRRMSGQLALSIHRPIFGPIKMVALVKDYMIRKREIVSPDDSVQSAIELMVDHDQGSVIVVSPDDKVIGIFTERDVLRRYLTSQDKFLHLKVSEVMSSPVTTVSVDTTVAEALALMNQKNVRRLPVVDGDGRMIGFVSWMEMFKNLPID